jgi:outer membrane PBP1 activator LpoA protein
MAFPSLGTFMQRIISILLYLLLLSGCTSLTVTPPAFDAKPITAVSEPTHLALLLPLSGNLAMAGQAVKEGFLAAYYASQPRSELAIEFYDTASQADIHSLYQQAQQKGADFIIGPLTKTEVQNLEKAFSQMPVPTLALNYSEPKFFALPKGLYEFGLSPLDEARQVASQINLPANNRALLITPQNSWGEGIAQVIQQTWTGRGGHIVAHLAYNARQPLSLQIKNILQVETLSDKKIGKPALGIDVILLAATPEAARQIRPLLKFYYAGNIPIYATASVYSGYPAADSDRDLDGIVFCDTPWTIAPSFMTSALYQQLANLAPQNFQHFTRLYALGIDAYHLMGLLSKDQVANNFTYVGATGHLSVYRRQIQRQLLWAQFKNGVPLLRSQP